MFILKIIGLINSIYLYILHVDKDKTCAVGSTCETVLNSTYSTFLNTPLAEIGISLYITLILISFFKYTKTINDNEYSQYLHIILNPAALIGFILIFIQAILIGAFCPFCTINSAILITLLILTYRNQPINLSSIGINYPIKILLVVIIIIPFLTQINKKTTFKETKGNEKLGVTIAGKLITLEELDRNIQTSLIDIEREIYDLRTNQIKQKIINIAAENERLSTREYIRKNVEIKKRATDEEALEFYNKRKKSIGKEFDEVKSKIKRHIKIINEKEKIQELVVKLEEKYNVQYNIPKPKYITIQENKEISVGIGDKNAPIRITEFADLECGHCKTAFFTMKEILAQYGDKIYFEFRHFPLPFHKHSREYAKASLCVADFKKDKYLDYLEEIFNNQTQLDKVTPFSISDKLELDTNQLKRCMNDVYVNDFLNEDIEEANRIEISSTPTFIINGQVYIGEITYETIQSYLK